MKDEKGPRRQSHSVSNSVTCGFSITGPAVEPIEEQFRRAEARLKELRERGAIVILRQNEEFIDGAGI
jgi:hypothetical protein